MAGRISTPSKTLTTLKNFTINEQSRIPKYQQIVNAITENMGNGNLLSDQKMPSINSLSEEYYLSRDTVQKAYTILVKKEMISSVKRQGYYISKTKLLSKTNILFLVNKLSLYKTKIYQSFIDSIGPNSHTDIQVYHYDESLFINLIQKHKSSYDYFVIMPHFKTENLKYVSSTEHVFKAIQEIPKEKLLVLDNPILGVNEDIIEIYQDFEADIHETLLAGFDKIKNYKNLILVYPEKSFHPYPKGILNGFRKFCIEKSLDFEVIDEIYDDVILKKGDLFITIVEDDLVNLMNQIRDDEFEIGKDIGVLSYNDTPLKDLLGISVLSTDFKYMGETAAKMILNNQKGQFIVPFNFIDRNSM